MLDKVRKIKPAYLVVIAILLIVVSYVGFRQYTTISCQRKSREGWTEYRKRGSPLFGPRLGLSDQVLYLEGSYQACMRAKGF